MVALSKAIGQEFLAALFSKAVFNFSSMTNTHGCIPGREHIPFIDQILNVDTVVVLSCYKNNPEACVKCMKPICVKPLEFFTGTEVLRNSCSIELYSESLRSTSEVQLPLITVMKGLTGFQIVTLQLHSTTNCYAASPRNMAEEIRSALEPSLGPSIFNKEHKRRHAWELTFRPRDYLANKNKVKAIASRSKDEGN